MAQLRLNQGEFADWLGVGRVTIHKITERKQAPTVEQAITLCQKANIDANWLLLNKGSKPVFEPITRPSPARTQSRNPVAAKR